VSERIVINTGPLVALDRIGCLEILLRLPYEFLCPEEVRRELDEGEAAGHPRIAPEGVRVVSLAKPISRVSLASLDPGEAAVIQLAAELSIPLVAIDEWKGRRAALAAGLGKAKMLGLVPSLKPLLEEAVAAGIRYHPALIRTLLEAVGEGEPQKAQ
jgi:predicted nucleic acid-binding protein